MQRHLPQPAQLHVSQKTAADRRSRSYLQPSTLNLKPQRSAFTLVELLVAMSIFVILATLTVGALRTNNSDRTGNSIGTIRNALEGARSRAINAGQPRGLRLLPDPNDNRIVTSMIYVGANGYYEGTGNLTYNATGPNIEWRFTNSNNTDWDSLRLRELVKIGNRIEIPAQSGNWFTIRRDPQLTINTMGSDYVALAGHYLSSVPDGSGGYNARPANGINYRLELSPTVLEGADPIVLSPQTCIDLDACVVPWRNSSGNYDGPLDIMFSPSGVPTGTITQTGIVHLRLAYVSDVTLTTGRPVTSATPSLPTDPEKEHKAISLFTSTGNIVRSEIGITGNTADGFNNNISTNTGNYYKFAIQGKESK